MKGDVYLSRLVCREIKNDKHKDEQQLGPEDVLSSMSPSKGLNMLGVHDDDVTRRRKPHGLEGFEQRGKLVRLCWSIYGTRDAASIWRATWSEV